MAFPTDTIGRITQAKDTMGWIVYILECADNTLYTGITNDLEARCAAHGAGKGAKYTKGRGPFTLLHQELYATRSDASKRELAIKKLNRDDKMKLCRS